MLWPPWETVPECSPQIQAWDYLGGYYIRCRGNFRDSNLAEPLGFGWNPTTCCHCLRRVHLYTEAPNRATPSRLNLFVTGLTPDDVNLWTVLRYRPRLALSLRVQIGT